jgi:hypothetical protein
MHRPEPPVIPKFNRRFQIRPKRFRLIHKLLFCFTVIALLPMAAFAQDEPDAPDAVGGDGEDNPSGVSGIYNGNVTTAGSYDPHTIAPNPNPYTKESTRRHEAVHHHTIAQGIKKYGQNTPAFIRWYANPKRFAEDEVKANSASIEYLQGLSDSWHSSR